MEMWRGIPEQKKTPKSEGDFAFSQNLFKNC